jgi:hypothetical protein
MKNVAIFLCVLFLCNGCKYFKKSSNLQVDTLTADTTANYTGTVDSTAYNSMDISSPVSIASTSLPTVKGKYYMIVGCFTVRQNADKYAEKIKGLGYEPQIIQGRDNFQMVSARSYDNYKQSIGELDKFRTEVTQNAWVFLMR